MGAGVSGGGAPVTCPPPLSVVHGLGFPSALEALRAGSSHIPSQVGQVAGFLARPGVVSSGPILFWVLLFYLLAQEDSEARHFPAVPAWPEVLFPEERLNACL